ncbi:hypothetical protein BpHYR1_049393 [Brachionus plicatilis]|uniref:Uncharacterized protein n=1 Tax=Brachionus plicatilis TaxID=10195 RepID=A0A3M7RDG1_BRAPC|nr:hypothetical protein BpHYR1_049393 [Brachionus plicatilis]
MVTLNKAFNPNTDGSFLGVVTGTAGSVRFGWYGSAPLLVRYGTAYGTVRHRLWYGSAVATLGGMSFLKYPLYIRNYLTLVLPDFCTLTG